MGAWVVRILVILGLLGSAWVHYDLWANEGFKDIDVVGPLFLVNAVAGVVVAIGVLVWHHWFPALAAVGFGAATLGAYVLSATVGFYGVQEQFTTSAEIWGVVTEAGCIVFGIILMAMAVRSRSRV